MCNILVLHLPTVVVGQRFSATQSTTEEVTKHLAAYLQ